MTTLLEAIRRALADAMAEDPRLVILGQDIGEHGGAFGATQGLLASFGKERVIDMPLSEAAVIGAAIGIAMRGGRAIAELQFMDFATCAGFDQLVSVAAKSRYRTGVAVPIVVRGPSGAGGRAGPFHSASLESFFVHTPGLKVVCPSTADDGYELLRAAIEDPDPVVFLEPKSLYRRPTGRGTSEERALIGRGVIRREGDAATVFTYGGMVQVALEAAESMTHAGEIRVVDLRTLSPLDDALIVRCVNETSRVLILHESPKEGGIAGEIAARINEQAFGALDAPILRVCGADTPVPHAPKLEDACLPNREELCASLAALLAY